MKNLYLSFAAVAVSFTLFAQTTATSVQNGNLMNPLTWDCTCVPIPGLHNVIIAHDVVLDTNYAVISGGSFTINSGASFVQDATPRAFGMTGGTLTNNGTLELDTFGIVAGTLTNNGNITFDQFGTYGTVVNNGTILTDSVSNFGTYTTNGTDTSLAYSNFGTHTNFGHLGFYNFTNSGSLTSWASGSLNTYNFWNTDSCFNHGSFTLTNFTNSGYYDNSFALNHATTNCTNLWNTNFLYNSGTLSLFDFTSSNSLNNRGIITISNNFYLEGAFDNWQYVDVGENFYNGDTLLNSIPEHFTNNGTLNVGTNFWNADTIDGSGHICVGQNSINDGLLDGTISFCDGTGGSIDINNGTVGTSVTYCDTAFTCFGPPPALGINNDIVKSVETIKFYPNPTNGLVTFEVTSNYNLAVYNMVGQVVKQALVSYSNSTIDVSDLETGVYLLQLTSTETKQIQTHRLVKQ